MEEAIKSLKVKNLQEFHLIGVYIDMFEYSETNITSFKLFLDMIAENMPKLQRLCLTCEDDDPNKWNEICQEFASRKNIKLEISSVLRCGCGTQPPAPWKTKIYSPPPPKIVL